MDIEARTRSRLSQLTTMMPALSGPRLRGPFSQLAVILTLVALWAITHRYKELTGDAELYAVQAFARIHSQLASDLYLKYGSQDQFTVFSPLYAWCIARLGLQNAALTLTVLCTIGFFAAAWTIARVSNLAKPELCVALLVITAGSYGAYGVFHYAEAWITARSVAEVLVLVGLACHLGGARKVALAIVLAAMLFHPIMAFPGFLLLMCLRVSFRVALIGAIGGIGLTLAIASDPFHMSSDGPFGRMDTAWLEVVRERSIFLFPQSWSLDDWKENARPFLSLAISALALRDERARKLCLSAMLVGAAGLAVAMIGGVVGPVAILVQGQAWRWVWITSFFAVLLIIPTASAVYRDARVGPAVALMLIAGWTFPAIDADATVSCALLLWLSRSRVNPRLATILRWATIAFLLILAAWSIATSWDMISGPAPDVGREPPVVQRIRNAFGVGTSALVVSWALTHQLRKIRSAGFLGVFCIIFATLAAIVLHGSFWQSGQNGNAAAVADFSDWRQIIAPQSNVYVAPTHNAANFAWFTLQRPSYLSIDQSSGVVFSSATSREVRRRAEVLLPLVDPSWRLLTRKRKPQSAPGVDESSRPLTKISLLAVCSDDQLDFVVAKENVGVEAWHHAKAGPWKGWNLYDCRYVRTLGSGA